MHAERRSHRESALQANQFHIRTAMERERPRE